MDRYFYSVELDGNENKIVHMCGNVYLNDADETETNHRCAEWTGLSFTLKDLEEEINNRQLFETLCENVRYLEDITECEAIKISEHYFGDEAANHLPIYQVNKETPCGCYWFGGYEFIGGK